MPKISFLLFFCPSFFCRRTTKYTKCTKENEIQLPFFVCFVFFVVLFQRFLVLAACGFADLSILIIRKRTQGTRKKNLLRSLRSLADKRGEMTDTPHRSGSQGIRPGGPSAIGLSSLLGWYLPGWYMSVCRKIRCFSRLV